MHLHVITLFPEMLTDWSGHGVFGRALDDGTLRMTVSNPRDFTRDVHRTVDDRPYGGGPGMVMKAGPLGRAIAAARREVPRTSPVVYLSPQGEPFTQGLAAELARAPGLVLLCGRYEGVDERIVEAAVDREVSIGDFVLSGGELAAMVVADCVARLVPGVLGHPESAAQDSFSSGLLDCPHYTRPPVFEGRGVPAVLSSGDHAAIRRWRMKLAVGRTRERRPDLLEKIELTDEQRQLLDEYRAGLDARRGDKLEPGDRDEQDH